MAAFAQTNRLLTFTSPLGANVLLPERLTGVEGVSELFVYQLELLALIDTTIDPKKIVGQKVCVGVSADDAGTLRYVNGIVSSFELSGGDTEFLTYCATIVPNLWALTLNKNTRVFQNKTVIDVIKDVLSPYNISPTNDTSSTFTPMEYCTQYRETDFAFVSRLMEQHGIFYYFKHTSDDHTLILQDVSSKLSDCAIQNSFRYAPQKSDYEGHYDFVVRDFSSRSSLVTGKYTAWDYSYIQYKNVPSGGASADTKGPLGSNSNEKYDYADSAASYLKKSDSDSTIGDLVTFFNNVRRDSGDAGTLIVEGESNAISMQTGYTFTLQKHPQDKLNVKYLLLHIEHTVQQLPSYRSRTTTPPDLYENKFVAIPSSITYRPPIKTEKPVVSGMHSGKVVAPAGEESHLDKYGRVNVQFLWDRQRKANTPDNTWLRVAQSWAGKGWGTYYWPREGDEVLVDFLEGDPDQPIVVGSIYNGVNMPKYELPGQYTLSGILTRSSKGGGAANANELRFEDLAGKEQIFMNAERDYDLHVEHDWHTLVGNEQHTKITSNRFDEVDGDSHLLVKGKHLEEVDGDDHLNIKGKNVVQIGGDREHAVTGNLKEKIGANSNVSISANLNQQVGSNYSLTVGQNQAIQAGMNFDVTAPMQISLNCGMNSIVLSPEGIGLNGAGGFISIGPAGVTISGMMVMINSGGAPVTGSPGSSQSPQSPGSPTAPTAPTFPGDAPPSQATASQSGAAATTPSLASGSSSSPAPSPAASPAAAASNAASQATQQASQAAQQASNEAQQAATQAQQSAQQAQLQAQKGVDQVVQQGRQTYQQANQAVQQAQQAVSQASAQGQAAAQQALNQAEQQAQQTAQSASQAVQQAQQQAQQVQQQANQAANQAQQAANQAQQQAQQAAQQAQQQASQAAQQGQQAAQQAQQQAQQAQQQAQQAANQAQQAAQQAQQQAQQAQQQVTQAASQSQQQAQQSAQQAQQSASQAMSQATKGF